MSGMTFTAKGLLGLILGLALIGVPPARGAGETVRIITIPVDGGAEVLYAREMGFFKRADLDVHVETLPNGAAIAAAVVSGNVDIGFSNLVSLALEYKKNIPVRIVAPGALFVASAPNAMCLVPRDSSIKTAKDLEGKTVAINGLKNISQFGPQAWMDASGADSKLVKFVEMPFNDIILALSQNRIDAGELTEPFVSQAKKVGRVLSNCMASVAKRYLISAYFTTTTWAQAHPEAARKFEEVMRQTAIWARKNQARSGEILAQEAKMNPQMVAEMVRSQYAERFDPADIQPVINLAVRYGDISESFPAADLFYRTLK
jgi:ABC-type nitrate/sulfonate/bicarbonate transport system substrate-binding protein